MINGYKINESFIKSENLLSDKFILKDIKSEINIFDYVHLNGEDVEFDGTHLMQAWFPKQNGKNVFISHSHNDIDLVKKFSGYLQDHEMNPFVDTSIWGSCEKLILDINKKYNGVPDKVDTYYYSKDHLISANIYMLLIRAINNMIDQCDQFIFIESNESINKEHTYSPWIAEELDMQSALKKSNFKKIERRSTVYQETPNIMVSHDIRRDLRGLRTIDNLEELYKFLDYSNRFH